MATYEYRCPDGHVTEHVFSMAEDKPEAVQCNHRPWSVSVEYDDEDRTAGVVVLSCDGEEVRRSRFSGDTCGERLFAAMRRLRLLDGPQFCGLAATRVFLAPAAVHYKGPGFYETDYRQKYDLKSRKRPADDLPIPAEAAITRAEGAEY